MIHWLAHKLGLRACPDCEVLVEFAMDGLPEGQQKKVRQHLADCPPCREQVRDFWQVREGLGLCSKQQDAPADLQAKVLARLREEQAQEPVGSACAGEPQRRPHLGGWPRFWMTVGPGFAVLSVVMTAVALGALLSNRAAVRTAPDNELSSAAEALMDDPHATRVALSPAGPSTKATGLLVLCPGRDRAYFRGENLSRCPLGSNYVLWMKPATGGAQRLARFTVEKDGGGVFLLQFDGAFKGSGPTDFMVTQDEAAGSQSQAWLKGNVSL